MPLESKEKSGRVSFFSALRVLAFLSIFYYHIVIEDSKAGYLSAELAKRLTEGANLNIAKTMVALFFILSGAGLFLANYDSLNPKEYYKKRIRRVLVPYWIASLAMFLFTGAYYKTGNPLKLLFNVFALDGYATTLGLPALYLVIGEWFIGCLVMMYIIFPPLRVCMLKRPYATMIVATVVYVILAFAYPFHVLPHENFFLKLYEFLWGMFLCKRWSRLPKYVPFVGAAVLIVLILVPALPIHESFITTGSALAMFLIFSGFEGLLKNANELLKIINVMNEYSFEVYLVHHVAIMFVLKYLAEITFSRNLTWIILSQVVLGVIGGMILRILTKNCLRLTDRFY